MMRAWPLRSLVACIGAAISLTANGQELRNHGGSYQHYLPAAPSSVQQASPVSSERSTSLEGDWRTTPDGFYPAPITEKSSECTPIYFSGVVELTTLATVVNACDINVVTDGVPLCIGRTYATNYGDSKDGVKTGGLQGIGWFQTSMPEIVLYWDGSKKQATDVLYLVHGAAGYVQFQRTAADADTFKGVNGASGVAVFSASGGSGSFDKYAITDSRGKKMTFWGSAVSGSNNASWQLWKVEHPDGKTLYVGDKTTESTAIAAYSSTGRISTMYQETGTDSRQYTFSYNAGDQLESVSVKTKTGGSWTGTPTGVKEISRVEYTYYTSTEVNGSDANDYWGSAGDLKSVTAYTPLSDTYTGSHDDNIKYSGKVYSDRTTYYRYYAVAWDSDAQKHGYPHALRLVVDAEGLRRYGTGYASASTSDLKPYSSAYFTYKNALDGDVIPVDTVFVNGQCGCGSGGVNGEVTFEKENNGSAPTDDSDYDQGWLSRTIVKTRTDAPTDATARYLWTTYYYDEAGQPLSGVMSDLYPGTTGAKYWATYLERDASGRIEKVWSPAAVNSYTHSSGSFGTRSSGGLVTLYTRFGGSDYKTGQVQYVKVADGSGGVSTPTTLSEFTYTSGSGTVSGVALDQPLIATRKDYVDGSNYEQLSYSYTFWSGLPYSVKKMTTTYPTVSSSSNGEYAPHTTESYFRQDGRVVWTKSRDGVLSYTSYNALGLFDKMISDANTGSTYSGEYASGFTPSDFSLTSTTAPTDPLRYKTTVTYDEVGRPLTTTLPSGRVTENYYSRLSDGRKVGLSFPLVASGNYTGPVTYAVTTLNDSADCSAMLAVGTLATPSKANWIDETSNNALDALDSSLAGTSRSKIFALRAALYDASGTRLTESRTYFNFPGSGSWTGTTGINYDASTYGYDNAGRVVRTQDATATITHTVYDTIGRVSSRWIGTDDTHWTGTGNGVGGGYTDNMTQVEALTYDDPTSGNYGGNSNVASLSAFVQGDSAGVGSSTDQRVTTYMYDVRGNLKAQLNPQAPHSATNYDLRRRITADAGYSSTSGLSETSDPTSAVSTRVSLNETFFDERGQPWKTTRHKISQGGGTAGNSTDSLDTTFWRDSMGRVIKTGGMSLVKTAYDRFGRAIHRYTLARTNDSTYSDASDVSGDVVLEQYDVVYDNADKTGNVVMVATIGRHSDDASTTGALDTNLDGNEFAYDLTGTPDVKGRISISAAWYDAIDRPTTTAVYGNNALSDFARRSATFTTGGTWLSEPGSTRASTSIINQTVYNDNGTVLTAKGPRYRSGTSTPVETCFQYDQALRKIAQIRNYIDGTPTGVSGDDDNYTRYTYSAGRMATMWIDTDGSNSVNSGDQVTTYSYGVVKTGTNPSAYASNVPLRSVRYPNGASSTAADNTVTYAYNAQGQRALRLDQNGVVHEYVYDTGGRQIVDKITSSLTGTGLDGSVLRIQKNYGDNRGLLTNVTQYNASSSGTATDEVVYAYDDWGSLTDLKQDNNGLVGAGGSVDDYDVHYTYLKADETGSVSGTKRRSGLRRDYTQLQYAGTTTLETEADYLSSLGGSTVYDGDAGRVTRVKQTITGGTLTLVEYQYMGGGSVVDTYLAVPQVRQRTYVSSGSGDKYGTYLDQLGRTIRSEWVSSAGGYYYVGSPSYDAGSNIASVDNYVPVWGQEIASDNLDRVVGLKMGTLSSGAVTGTAHHQEQWRDGPSGTASLTQTGNWVQYTATVPINSATDLDVAGAFRDNNQYASRDADGTGSTTKDYTSGYDKAGNLTDDDTRTPGSTYTYGYQYVYDGWNRLVSVKSQTGNVVEEFRYNGLDHRIAWHYDYTNSSSGGPDGTVDSYDKWHYFQYNERWQQVAVYKGTDVHPTEQFVHHQAGWDGEGLVSSADAVILRERDTNADGTIDEHLYYLQNWRYDVVMTLSESGKMRERIRYDAYGTPYVYNPADVGRQGGLAGPDGILDNNDFIVADDSYYFSHIPWCGDFGTGGSTPTPDGAFDSSNDPSCFIDLFFEGASGTGKGRLSRGAIGNRRGYAGYEFDPVLGTGTDKLAKYHVRNRVLDCTTGKWQQMDPLGYVDGTDVYEYCRSDPADLFDWSGLACSSCAGPPDHWDRPDVDPNIEFPNELPFPAMVPPGWEDFPMRPYRPTPYPASWPCFNDPTQQWRVAGSTMRKYYCFDHADSALYGRTGTPKCLSLAKIAYISCCMKQSGTDDIANCTSIARTTLATCNSVLDPGCYGKCMRYYADKCFWIAIGTCGVKTSVKSIDIAKCLMNIKEGSPNALKNCIKEYIPKAPKEVLACIATFWAGCFAGTSIGCNIYCSGNGVWAPPGNPPKTIPSPLWH